MTGRIEEDVEFPNPEDYKPKPREKRPKSMIPVNGVCVMSNEMRGAVCHPCNDAHFGFLEDTILDMRDIMDENDGMGLAAPQVTLWIRMAVIRPPEDVREQYANFEDLMVICNPTVTSGSGVEVRQEGCLSIPNYRLQGVPRLETILFTYQDMNGAHHEGMASGLMARAIQHEVDHLDGIFYIDRLPSKLMRKLELEKYSKRAKIKVW